MEKKQNFELFKFEVVLKYTYLDIKLKVLTGKLLELRGYITITENDYNQYRKKTQN